MKHLGWMITVCILGFVLGVGIAYWQNASEVKQSAEVTEEISSLDAPTVELAGQVIVPGAPPQPQPETTASSSPAPGVGGSFALTDHNGNAVTQESWPGKYKVIFFGFTRCPAICPMTLGRLTAALEELQADLPMVQTLFITVDPAMDTPEIMKTYLASYHPSIIGLTGTEEQVKQAEESYKIYAAKMEEADGSYLMDHSGFIYLMSPDDAALKVFKSDETVEALAAGIKAEIAAASSALQVIAPESDVYAVPEKPLVAPAPQ